MMGRKFALLLIVAVGASSASSQPECRTGDAACNAGDDVGLMQRPVPSETQLNPEANKATVSLLQGHLGDSITGKSSISALSVAMGQLASDVVNGKTVLSPQTKAALKGIMDEMQAVFVNAKETQAADLKLVRSADTGVQECDQPILGNSEWGNDAASKKTSHDNCRTDEADFFDTKEKECGENKTLGTNTRAPDCLFSFPANPTVDDIRGVETCVARIVAWAPKYKEELAQAKNECDAATKNHADKKVECNTAQSTYESHFCTFHQELTSKCAAYSTCRAERLESQKTTNVAVRVSLASRNSEVNAAQHIQCFLGVLNATAETQPGLLSECLRKIEAAKDAPAQYAIPPAKEHPEAACNVSPVASVPCDDTWIGAYESQLWHKNAPTVACSSCAHIEDPTTVAPTTAAPATVAPTTTAEVAPPTTVAPTTTAKADPPCNGNLQFQADKQCVTEGEGALRLKGGDCRLKQASGEYVKVDYTLARYTKFKFAMKVWDRNTRDGNINPHFYFFPCYVKTKGHGGNSKLWFIDRSFDWGYGAYGLQGAKVGATHYSDKSYYGDAEPNDEEFKHWEIVYEWDANAKQQKFVSWSIQGVDFSAWEGGTTHCPDSSDSGWTSTTYDPLFHTFGSTEITLKDFNVYQGSALGALQCILP